MRILRYLGEPTPTRTCLFLRRHGLQNHFWRGKFQRLPLLRFSLACDLMNRSTAPSWHFVTVDLKADGVRRAWDGVVPVIR